MFQLTGANGQLITIDTNCGNGQWAFFYLNSALDKAIFSTLIMTKATGMQVRVGVNGCLAPPAVISVMPLVEWVDLDLRD
jgi:hypothetical protein